MKYFLVKVEIRDGEMEYREAITIRANTLDEAGKIAEKNLTKEFSFGKGDYRLFEIASIQEIQENTARALSNLGLSYCIN
jgi:hypothetical protein